METDEQVIKNKLSPWILVPVTIRNVQ